jgi:hypothetical protein
MQTQMLLPLESDGREQRRQLWSQIPERDRIECIARCARLVARAARIVAAPQQEEERREASAS